MATDKTTNLKATEAFLLTKKLGASFEEGGQKSMLFERLMDTAKGYAHWKPATVWFPVDGMILKVDLVFFSVF